MCAARGRAEWGEAGRRAAGHTCSLQILLSAISFMSFAFQFIVPRAAGVSGGAAAQQKSEGQRKSGLCGLFLLRCCVSWACGTGTEGALAVGVGVVHPSGRGNDERAGRANTHVNKINTTTHKSRNAEA